MAEGNGVDAQGVLVRDREHGLPYSKGLMANSMMAAGIPPSRAYPIAKAIEDRLNTAGPKVVSTGELRALTVDMIRENAGERYADKYLKWQLAGSLDVPIVILLGGATGVGKSTLATQLAARMGIVRIISTDAIREVMKAVFTEEIMPTLYTSSFDAADVVRPKASRGDDAVLVGFRDQVAAVSAGVKALIERAVAEGTDVIIEGAHLVPGFAEPDLGDNAVVVRLVVAVDDEDLHRSHFFVRAHETRARPSERYLKHFSDIRKIQKYIKSVALQHNVPVVQNYNLDSTLAGVIELIVTRAVEAAKADLHRAVRDGKGDHHEALA